MAVLARFIVLIPLVFSIVSAVLTALALFAGHEKGFMEDYAVARMNTSMIGHNMFTLDEDSKDDDNKDDEDDNDDDDDGGFFDDLGDDISDTWDDVQQSVEDKLKEELNDITGSIADELAETLGVAEWYSMHVMSSCEGYFKPNATASKGLNITECSRTAPNDALNLTELLDHELSVGPFEISLNDINWPDEVQDAINAINDVLLAMFVLYVLGIGFSGIGVFTAAAAFVFAGKRSVMLINLAVSALAAICILVGSILVTVAVTAGIDQINDVGDDVGIAAKKGDKFLGITWAAAAMMVLSTVIWCGLFFSVWRERKRSARSHRKSSI